MSTVTECGDLLPIFPLQYVLLPGMPLPLHIFEPRYRQLIADVTDEGSECFGIVTLRRGNENGQGRVHRHGRDRGRHRRT